MAQKIYPIMTMEKIEIDKRTGCPDFGAESLVGFYMDKEMAFAAVKENCCDLWETVYNYALVEEIEEGLYHSASRGKRWFFRFNTETQKYEPIKEPTCLAHFSGFTF